MSDGPRQEAVDNGTGSSEDKGISRRLFFLEVKSGENQGNARYDNGFEHS